MKKLFYSILFSILFFNASAQFTYQWANAVGTASGAEYGEAIGTDASGNVYVTGLFTGTSDFSTGTAAITLTSKGGQDVFLAKYDPNGNIIYAMQLGGSNDEMPYDIYVNGNAVFVVGKFKGTCDFDPSTTNASLTYVGGGTDGDGFCAKYDLNGNYQWAFQIGSTGNDRALGITGDATGDIVISGFFSNTADFNPSSTTVNLTATGYDAYFAKYTSAGAYVFAKQIAGDYSEANDIKCDASGNIFLLCDWSEVVDVDPSGATVNITTSSQLNFGIFLAKYSPTGAYAWHKTMGNTGLNIPMQVEVTATNIFIGGLFSGTNDFDPSISTANLISVGGSDIFFAKYDLTGAYQFAYSIGGPSNDYLNGLAIDAASNIFITGKFSGTNVNFNAAGLGTGSSLLSGSNTGYVAQYLFTGNFVAAHALGSSASEGKAIYTANSSVYYTGYFQGTVDFDFSTGGTANLASLGGDDIFVSKLGYGPTVIETNENENNILIYPNPSNGIFSVNNVKGKLEVYNSLGEIIFQKENKSNENLLIDLSNKAAGIYIIKLNNENGIIQQKIIID